MARTIVFYSSKNALSILSAAIYKFANYSAEFYNVENLGPVNFAGCQLIVSFVDDYSELFTLNEEGTHVLIESTEELRIQFEHNPEGKNWHNIHEKRCLNLWNELFQGKTRPKILHYLSEYQTDELDANFTKFLKLATVTYLSSMANDDFKIWTNLLGEPQDITLLQELISKGSIISDHQDKVGDSAQAIDELSSEVLVITEMRDQALTDLNTASEAKEVAEEELKKSGELLEAATPVVDLWDSMLIDQKLSMLTAEQMCVFFKKEELQDYIRHDERKSLDVFKGKLSKNEIEIATAIYEFLNPNNPKKVAPKKK